LIADIPKPWPKSSAKEAKEGKIHLSKSCGINSVVLKRQFALIA